MNLMLSIIVTTYNHENYIEKAIDSILMQKVDFEYEVLIGEDCSTDNTREVLKGLEKKCGDNFHFIYRECNTYKNPDKFPLGNSSDLKAQSKGKYMIVLEGDDYWIDPLKLQKQVDFLETHPEYYACAHECIVVNEYDEQIEREYLTGGEGDYDIRYLASNVMPGQTATFLHRNPYISYSLKELDFIVNPNYYIGDRRTVFFAATHGKIKTFPEKMSAYRYVKSSGSSFSASDTKSFENEYPHYKSFVDYCICNNINGDYKKYAEFMLYFFLLKCFLRKKISFKELRHYSKRIPNHPYYLFASIMFLVKKGIFRMKIAY